MSPAPANRATVALTASSGARKSPISTIWPARGSGSNSGRPAARSRCSSSCASRVSADAAADRRDAAAEQRQPLAAAHQQARQRQRQEQLGAVALRPAGARCRPSCNPSRPSRRATARRSAPPPIRSRARKRCDLGAVAPVDAGGGVARRGIGGTARTSRPGRPGGGRGRPAPPSRRPAPPRPAAAAGAAACSAGRSAPGAAARRARARLTAQRQSPQRRHHPSMTCATVTPSARRGEAERHAVAQHRRRQRQHVIDRRRIAAVDQRAGAEASISAWLARGPGPQAT